MSKGWTIVHISGGSIVNKTAVINLLLSCKDGKHLLEISSANKRSNQQNRYLHGVLIPEFRKALNGVGYNEVKTNEQAKLIMKSMFLTREVRNDKDEKVHYVQDTSALTKEEIGVLIEEVVQFAAENMSYVIPYPNEQVMLWE